MGLKFNKKKSAVEDEDDEQPKKKSKPVEDDAEDDEEEETPKKKGKASDDEDDDSEKDEAEESDEDDDKPPFKADKKSKKSDDDEDDEEAPPKKSKAKASDDDDEDDDKADKKPKSFLKRGKEKAAALKAADEKAEQRAAENGRMWRFFIPKDKIGDDFTIMFLDGDLDDDGLLDTPAFYEHTIKVAGRLKQFVSCCENEPDPLQEAGQEPYFAQAFTIIDQNEFKDREGKKHKYAKRLFVVKRGTLKQLQKLATKRGGLRGCVFEVSRTGKKSPSVGEVFQFVEKLSEKQIKAKLLELGAPKEKVDEVIQPADYDKELLYLSAKDIKKMGLVDTQKTISSKAANEDADDVDEEL